MVGGNARRTPCASLLLSLAAGGLFLLPSLVHALEFDRAAIAAGEVWRLVTGHWVHFGFEHLFWDVLAFGCLGAACERSSRARFLACVAASACAISAAVWFWLPEMTAYRGLSGIDSALFGLLFVGLASDAVRARSSSQVALATTLFAAFLLKVAFEVFTGGNVFVKSMEAGAVGVPLAHVVGVTVGVLVGLAPRALPLALGPVVLVSSSE